MSIAIAPGSGCPPSLLADQVALAVRHVGMDGGEHDGLIEVHREVVADVTSFFALALRLRFPIERVVPASEHGWDDERLMAANCSSGFNFRRVAGTDRLSWHAFGLAFDVNTRLNPYLRPGPDGVHVDPAGATYDPDVPGTLSGPHPLVDHLRDRGWTWGGDWTFEADGCVDYQHFNRRIDPDERAEIFARYGLADPR